MLMRNLEDDQQYMHHARTSAPLKSFGKNTHLSKRNLEPPTYWPTA